MKNVQKRIPVLERLAEEMQVLSEAEQRSFIGGDYWDDHGVWSMDSNGNSHWTRTSSGDGYYYGSSDDYGSSGYGSNGYYGSSSYYGRSGDGRSGTGSGIISQDQFYNWSGDWPGGYVEGIGYVAPDTIIYGSSGYYGDYGSSDDYGSSGYYEDYGSSGDSDGNQYRQPQSSGENQSKWNSIKFSIFNQAQFYNIDLSRLTIIGVGNDSWSNAWVGPNKEVCLEWRFFNLTDQQKLRVLFEEYYHVMEDKPINNSAQKIQTILPQPPEGVKRYLMATNNFEEGEEEEFQKWFDDDYRYSNIIDDPNYYWNEVNANKKVKQLMYNHLSEKERNEIDYKIWYYTISLNAANNN